jgi:acetolactate synthase-1/2/3 large subunit
MMKLSDYIFRQLRVWGAKHIFLVTGGGAMHLNDSIGTSGIKYICTHHEQAAAMAAEGYARITNTPGLLNVTTGPGSINALNGVFGAWTDSIPMLVLSGQVKRETCMQNYGITNMRQLGDQEVDIIRMVKGITKYSVWVNEPETIAYHLERAWYLARIGRPGPCWLDIPVDVQSAQIDETKLRHYDPSEDQLPYDPAQAPAQVAEVLEKIAQAKRPVLMVGSGVRLAGAAKVFREVIERLGIPVTTAWTAIDMLPTGHPLHAGRPAVVGDRPGNIAIQNADVLLVVGSRLPLRQTSYNWNSFAAKTFKIQVDVDPVEMEKPTLKPQMALQQDAKAFLEAMNLALKKSPVAPRTEWNAWCQERVRKYPVVQQSQRDAELLNPYHFTEILFGVLQEGDVIACGDGMASVVPFQAAQVKEGQRLFTNAGSASMGYDLPASVGAAVANAEINGGRRVICLAGDGSLQMNIQELQTVVHHQLPVKVIVYNNNGYLSIRTTQNNFFGGNLVGEGPTSGVSFPDPVKLAQAYGIPAIRVQTKDCAQVLQEFLARPGPGLVEAILDPAQGVEPRLTSRVLADGSMVTAAFEDMYPFLDRDELASNMPTWDS